jgi:WD40 repeat protein
MKIKYQAIFLILVLLSQYNLLADQSVSEKISHPKSECIIEISGGEYPLYKVNCNGKIIYSPSSDGIVKAIFSPSGKQIAFSGSEINGVDIKKGEYDYSVVVLECSTGKLKGFKKGIPNPDLKWITENKLSFTDAATGKEVIIDLEPTQ